MLGDAGAGEPASADNDDTCWRTASKPLGGALAGTAENIDWIWLISASTPV